MGQTCYEGADKMPYPLITALIFALVAILHGAERLARTATSRPGSQVNAVRSMSALDQKQKCAVQNAMSALPPKADITPEQLSLCISDYALA